MKKGNTAPAFQMPQSKKAAEEQAAKNQAWWDRWDAGERGSTYLHVPSDVRVIEPDDPRVSGWRKTTP